MKQILFLLTSILIAFSCSSPINQTNKEYFTKEDSSLVKYEIPEWYQDAKIVITSYSIHYTKLYEFWPT